MTPQQLSSFSNEDRSSPIHRVNTGSYSEPGRATSCETAAQIIAGMRNQDTEDMQDTRTELGCSSRATCMVDNMAIFEVLDK